MIGLELTEALLRSIDADLVPLAPTPSKIFVWPTESCQVGCRHCNFGSSPSISETTRSDDEGAAIAAWASEAHASQLVLCGGGEPLEEPDYCAGAFAAAAKHRLPFALYTSGSSPYGTAAEAIHRWLESSSGREPPRVWIRLSLDRFHEEKIGVDPVVEWISSVRALRPRWRLSIRMLRVQEDRSAHLLAQRLGAELLEHVLVLRDGKRVVIDERGFVLDGRASLRMLKAVELDLTAEDRRTVEQWCATTESRSKLGRLLSRRTTVGIGRVDLEIRDDDEVQLLESQPCDHRLRWESQTWPTIRDSYCRDPVIHAVSSSGLSSVAKTVAGLSNRGALETGAIARSIGGLPADDVDDG